MVSRYEVGQKCSLAAERYFRSVLKRRLGGAGGSVEKALLGLKHGDPSEGEDVVAALAGVGIFVERISSDEGDRVSVLRMVFRPALLHTSFKRLPKRISPRFAFCLEAKPHGISPPRAHSGRIDFTRYSCGTSDADELRMQVEILRQDLVGLDLSIDAALDELCRNLALPHGQASERCDRLSLALGEVGLRFQPAMKSWRLPRPGVLMLKDPDRLVRAYPSLGFFEPERFVGTPIVDRPEFAGKDVNQGLLF